MKINWKTRFRNKTFIIALLSSLVLLSQQLGYDVVPDNWNEVVNTGLTVLIMLGVVVDPTTEGIHDAIEESEEQ